MRSKLLCGIILVAVAAAVPAYANEWSKTYHVAGHPMLRFDTNDGGIRLISTSAKEIEARVVTEGWEIGKDVQISESQTGDSVEIRVRIPQISWQFFNINRRSIHIELRVPAESDLDLHTGDGSVDLQAVWAHPRRYRRWADHIPGHEGRSPVAYRGRLHRRFRVRGLAQRR